MWILYSTSRSFTKTISVRRHNLIKSFLNLKNVKLRYQYAVSKIEAFATLSPATMNVDTLFLEKSKSELLRIFDAGINAVFPNTLIEDQVKFEDNKLIIRDESYPLEKNVYLVGFGKAVAGMAFALEKILGERLKRGIISVPPTDLGLKAPEIHESLQKLREQRDLQIQNWQMLLRSKVIECKEGGKNNQPDEDSLAATESIIELVKGLGNKDTLIVLISGGGSALLFQPKPPVTMELKRDLCKKLQNAGASITELNAVRKMLSNVKGGGLARIAFPAKLLTFILSDVVGDPVDYIASGPTCPIISENPQEEAIEILKKYKLYNRKLDPAIKEVLTSEIKNDADEQIEDGSFKFVKNIIIGNNLNALNAAKKAVDDVRHELHLESSILSSTVEGDVSDLSFAYAKFTRTVCLAMHKKFDTLEDFVGDLSEDVVQFLKMSEEKLAEVYELSSKLEVGQGIVLLAGGEPSVVVKGDGLGGRNQELALSFSLDWLEEVNNEPLLSRYFVQILSAGTDGQDGPTDATGAFGRPAIPAKMVKIRKNYFQKLQTTPEDLKPDLQNIISQAERYSTLEVLKRNDSYCFYQRFEKGENLLKIGLTGTNVMDLHLIYIKNRGCQCNPIIPDDLECSCLEDDFIFC